MIAEFRNFSIPQAPVDIQVYPKLVYTILYDNLNLKPQKFHEWHKFMEKGKILPNMHLSLPSVATFHFICCDEAYFYLFLPLNKQNNRIRGDSEAFLGVEIALKDEKVYKFEFF